MLFRSGSALNSTQVGSLRAAEHISAQPRRGGEIPHYSLPEIRYGTSNLRELREELQSEMSRVADFDRSTEGMERLYRRVDGLCRSFFAEAAVETPREHWELFRLYDAVLTQRSVLSAMLCSARTVGTHGSALVDRKPQVSEEVRTVRTVTRGGASSEEPVSPMPTPELWFEKLLAKKRREAEGFEK